MSISAYAVERPALPITTPARIRPAAALLPSLILRVTYRARGTSDIAFYDSPIDAWQWPVPYGVSFEVRAVWNLDRLTTPHLFAIDPVSLDPTDPDSQERTDP